MTRPAVGVRPGVPRPVQVACGLLVLVALYHLAFPLLQLTQAHLGEGRTIQSIAQNAFLLAVTGLVILLLPTGRRWARRPATFSQVLTILTGAILWPAQTDLAALAGVVDALSVAILILLWAPGSSRAFFARHRPSPHPRATPRGLRPAAPASAPTTAPRAAARPPRRSPTTP